MLITSLENSKIKELKKLKTKKYKDNENKFIIEGEHLVKEAYECGLLEEIYMLEGNTFNIDIKTYYVTKEILKEISSLDNPNIVGVRYSLPKCIICF